MTDITKFKKILALIPEELYDLLSVKNMFNRDWDFFVTQAIKEKLERDEI